MVDPDGHRANRVLIPELSIITDAYLTSDTIPKDVLKQKYLENGLSTRQIANEFSRSKTHVRDLLLKYEIPLKTRSESQENSRAFYGKRKVKGKVIEHKGEARTIETIKKMYNEEICPSAIARFLNSMKVPTKQQGRKWHHYTIITILKREGIYTSKRKGEK
jgi:transposase